MTGLPTSITVELLIDGTWTDISDYTDLPAGISVKRGRSDEFGAVGPGTASLTLDNVDGRFTPDNQASPYWPHIAENARIRISATTPNRPDPEDPYGIFSGYVDRWTVKLDGGVLATAQVEATDQFKFMQNRVLQAPWVMEYMKVANTETGIWPLTQDLTSPVSRGITPDAKIRPTKTGTGTVEFVTEDPPPHLPGSVKLTAPALGPIIELGDPFDFVDGGTIAGFFKIPYDLNGTIISQIAADGSKIMSVDSVDGDLTYTVTSDATTTPTPLTAFQAGSVDDGHWHFLALSVAAGGATMRWRVDALAGSATGQIHRNPSGTLPIVLGGWQYGNTGHNISVPEIQFAGWAVYPGQDVLAPGLLNTTDVQRAVADSFDGDTGAQRTARLNSYGLPIVAAPSNIRLTPLVTEGRSELEVAQEHAAALGGPLVVEGDGTLRAQSASDRWVTAPHATFDSALDCSGSPTFERSEAIYANEVTATSPVTSIVVSNPAGIDAVGPITDSFSLNIQSVDLLRDMASMRLEHRTNPQTRLAQVSVDPFTSPTEDIYDDVLSCDVSSKVRVTGLPAAAPGPSMDLYVEAVQHQITDTAFTTTLDTSPVTVTFLTFDDLTTGRLVDDDVTQLDADLTATATTLHVVSALDVDHIVPFSIDTADYPLDLEVGGERVTAADPPSTNWMYQTFVVMRGVAPTVGRPHLSGNGTGTEDLLVRTWHRPVFAP